jgi:hypothetical protein
MIFTSISRKICNRLRWLVDLVFHFSKCHIARETNPQISANYIYDAIVSDKPCMIARYGSVELYCLTNYLGVKKGWTNFIKYILGKSEAWWWIPQRLEELKNNAGFFSLEIPLVKQYCETILADTKELDILASWISKEKLIEKELFHSRKIFLPHLEPYYALEPWTRALEGKKILVVHPFAKLIKHQYQENRTKLFKNDQVLPLFDLKIFPAIQSIGGESNGFLSWFDALDYMKSEIDKIDYDIAIIGCGAYGFHLAAHVKRSGKKAIHMGGATQLLFGIKGNRWEDPMYGVKEWNLPYGFYTNMFNEYWVKPGEEGRPKNAESVEGACYW